MTAKEALLKAKALGFRVYEVKGHTNFGYILTHKGNVLSVCNSQWGEGVTFNLKYVPNKRSGSGCTCHNVASEWDFGITTITVREINKLEKRGLQYAHRLHAPMYENVNQWLEEQKLIWKDSLVEVC